MKVHGGEASTGVKCPCFGRATVKHVATRGPNDEIILVIAVATRQNKPESSNAISLIMGDTTLLLFRFLVCFWLLKG